MLAEYYQQPGDRLFPMKKNAIAIKPKLKT